MSETEEEIKTRLFALFKGELKLKDKERKRAARRGQKIQCSCGRSLLKENMANHLKSPYAHRTPEERQRIKQQRIDEKKQAQVVKRQNKDNNMDNCDLYGKSLKQKSMNRHIKIYHTDVRW
jgi:hypothetical protein